MEENLIRNFSLYFPKFAERAVKYKLGYYLDLAIKLEDGTTIIYDDEEKTIRSGPTDANAMCEEECKKEFGMRLRQVMWHKGFTQEDLSEKTGITQALISNYMTGKRSPSFYAVDKIAKALNCSVDEFRYLD